MTAVCKLYTSWRCQRSLIQLWRLLNVTSVATSLTPRMSRYCTGISWGPVSLGGHRRWPVSFVVAGKTMLGKHEVDSSMGFTRDGGLKKGIY